MSSSSYIGKSPQYGVFNKQNLSAPISGSAITLDRIAADTRQLIVVVGGIIQEPETSYTINAAGTQLTFAETPDTSLTGWIIYLGQLTTGPRIQADSLTSQTALGAQPATDDEFLLYDTSAGDLKKVDFSYMQSAMGDITGVTAGNGLTGGGTSGAVSLAVGAGTGITVNSGDIQVDAAQPTITSLANNVVINTSGAITTTGAFTSIGIDDNASANAITIESDGDVLIGTTTASTSRLHVYDTDFPTITGERFKTGETNSIRDVTNVILKTDADAADGFGPAMRFDITDSGVTGQAIGSIGFIRDGSDSNGAMIVRSGNSTELFRASTSEIKCPAQAYFPETTLSFNATQTWDVSTNQVTRVVPTANVTFSAPTNQLDGAFYSLMIEQDGTGSRTASWNTVFKWAAGTAPTLTTTASAKDIFVFRSDGTNMYEVGRQLNVS